MRVISHGNFRDLFSGTSSEQPVDLTHESASQVMAGGLVAWLSKLQSIVATSSMEAVYIACYYLVQDILWLRDVLQELGLLDNLLQLCTSTTRVHGL